MLAFIPAISYDDPVKLALIPRRTLWTTKP